MSAAPILATAPARAFIGIHDGHNSSVAVVRDGRLQFAMQEERLTRIKNQGDAPTEALARAFDLIGGGLSSTDRVALNGHYMNYHQWERETVMRDSGKPTPSTSSRTALMNCG